MVYRIPRSRLWSFLRDGLKPALKRLLGARLYHKITERWYWAAVFANYAVIRHPLLRRLFPGRTGVWSHTIYIEGTNICNAKCVFCAYPQMDRPKQTMSMDHFRSVERWAALGGDEADLTPIVGDPFVDKHILERLDFCATSRASGVFTFTNAILMKPALEQLCGYGERLTVCAPSEAVGKPTPPSWASTSSTTRPPASRASPRPAPLSSSLLVQLSLRSTVGSESSEFRVTVSAREARALVIDRIHFRQTVGRHQADLQAVEQSPAYACDAAPATG